MVDRIWVLAKRELSAFFFSPIAYVVAAVFLAVSGVFFADVFMPGREAQMRDLFDRQAFILVFIVPLLTMRVLAEEFRAGTIESLMTAPVCDFEVVLGKYLGTMLFYAAMLAPTLIFAALILGYGHADPGPIVSGYLGLVLLGGFYVAVGILTSSVSRHQLVSGALAFLILGTLTFLLFGGDVAGDGGVADAPAEHEPVREVHVFLAGPAERAVHRILRIDDGGYTFCGG